MTGDVETRIDAAKAMALRAVPYARHVISSCQFVITDKLPVKTAACDKYWRVYIHPETTLNVPELSWVILHEALGHLVRGHCKAIELHPDVSSYDLNVAQDLEIESWEWTGAPERPSGENEGLHPSQFNLPVGKVWQWYLENMPKSAKQSGVDCGSGAHGEARDWELGERNAPVTPGSPQERLIKKATAEAIKKASKAGDVPAGMAVWADVELTPPQIDWRRALRTKVNGIISAGVVDMIGPSREKKGVMVPRWRKPRPRIALVADTSGSMSGEGGNVLGSAVSLCRKFGAIDVVWIDDEPILQRSVRSSSDLKPVGGGGTDLIPAINLCREENYDSVVIITDCETPWPEASKSNEIVLATSGGKPPQNWRYINVY